MGSDLGINGFLESLRFWALGVSVKAGSCEWTSLSTLHGSARKL